MPACECGAAQAWRCECCRGHGLSVPARCGTGRVQLEGSARWALPSSAAMEAVDALGLLSSVRLRRIALAHVCATSRVAGAHASLAGMQPPLASVAGRTRMVGTPASPCLARRRGASAEETALRRLPSRRATRSTGCDARTTGHGPVPQALQRLRAMRPSLRRCDAAAPHLRAARELCCLAATRPLHLPDAGAALGGERWGRVCGLSL